MTKPCSKCKRELPMTIEYFREYKKAKSGFRSQCRDCERAYRQANKERELARVKKWKEENKEYVKERDKKYREVNKEKLAEQCRQWREKNKERIRENDKKYRENNKERLAKSKAIWRENNKEHISQSGKEYREKNKERIKKYFKQYNKTNSEVLREKARKWREENLERAREVSRLYSKNNPEKIREINQSRRARLRELDASLTVEQWETIKEHFEYKCAYCGKKKKLEQEHFIPLSAGGEYTHNNIIPACKKCNCSKYDKSFFEWYPEQEYYNKKRELAILNFLGYDTKTQTQQITIGFEAEQ